ncbi:hypothetical protein CAPTEDRAFT_184671 [Capitella teleta]|uniref:Membrane magnesium transporter n=1 Tax=Capitella teleta TaxID=283909 RepID=R7VMF1_CAPTE|nr:hypothetical protein CAPTEDRAFT_184671 [Capitella teleta]|eukprot:ELU18730.1 hypothetical protein CAPTEDRAFT_184671 [Capitella teleta]
MIMGLSMDKVVVCFGLISLAHSAYSAAQHRAYLRLTEQSFTSLPLDVLVQCFVSFVLTCYGIVRVVGKFKEINSATELEKRSWETMSNRPAFYCFNHRGKSLYRNCEEEDAQLQQRSFLKNS